MVVSGSGKSNVRGNAGSALILAIIMLGLAASAFAQDEVAPDPPGTHYGTGYLPSPPSETRGVRSLSRFRAFLPASVDLSGQLPAVGQQGEIGSCVAWATGYAARAYYVSRFEGKSLRDQHNLPSPAYIYGMALEQDGIRNCQRGMTVPQALELLKTGAVGLDAMPYDGRRCSPPAAAIRQQATRFRIQDWLLIDIGSLDSIKGELARGHPVIFAMTEGEEFRELRRHAVYRRQKPHRGPTDHAMTVVGYEEERQAFLIINSWGAGWGNKGYAWLSYETFARDALGAFAMRPVNEGVPVAELPKPVPPGPPSVEPPKPPVATPPRPPKPTPALAECASVAVAERSGRQILEGFAGRQEDIDRLKRLAAAQGNDFAVDLRPWPQCEALLTLDKALAAADRPAVRLLNGANLKAGDVAAIEVIAPDKPAHLHVAYIQADGTVAHLVQSDAFNLKTYDGRKTLRFGDGEDSRALFRVSEPFGREMVLVLASRAPLFPEPRPQKETERAFLTALRKALLWKPEEGAAEREVSAAFAPLETRKE
jgi:hypothetical protein